MIRRGARRPAHRHHRGHRVPRYRARGTAAPLRPRLPPGPGRAARAAGRSRAGPARDPRNDCFDRLRAELGDRFEAEVATRVTSIAGDVAVDGLGLDAAGRSRPRRLRHGDPLGRHRQLRLPARRRRGGQPARARPGSAGHRTAAADADGVGPHLIAVSTAYVAGTRRGQAPEAILPETPFAADVAWRPEVARARRARDDIDAASRDPELLARFRKPGPGRARRRRDARSWRPRPSSSGREWVKDRMVEAGKARAAGPRLARRLRLHQGPRRAGPARHPG